MSDPANEPPIDGERTDRSQPQLPSAVETTETYRTDDGTVFYDAENPLAWIQTDAATALAEWA